MAQLAIKGHATRGKEVIETLKMLGGKEEDIYNGNEKSWVYFINKDGFIDCEFPYDKYEVFSLEEFLEKFPYKVGDKVLLNGIVKTIKQARWDSIDNEVIYKIETNIRGFSEEYFVHYYDLQPYKKEIETMKELKIDIPNGYEFFGIDDDNKIVLTKKQPQYPHTYKECCKVLGYSGNYNMILTTDVDNKLFDALYRLKVCRDAYWKIAGKQMGLGKSWKPDFGNGLNKCCLTVCENQIIKSSLASANAILAFPTEEMRDAFYENFKELIEQCKELL